MAQPVHRLHRLWARGEQLVAACPVAGKWSWRSCCVVCAALPATTSIACLVSHV